MEETKEFVIDFQNVSEAEANKYAAELMDEILDSSSEVTVERKKVSSDTQDFGTTLVLVLGTPAAIAVANAIVEWIKRRNQASISIKNSNGELIAENITSDEAVKLAELFISGNKNPS